MIWHRAVSVTSGTMTKQRKEGYNDETPQDLLRSAQPVDCSP
jgi:hypothetical protein